MKNIYHSLMIPGIIALSVQMAVPSFAQTGGATYQAGPTMNRTRIAPMMSLLDNGKVIAFGGREVGFVSSPYADIYDPATNTFSEVTMNTPRDFPAVCKLSDGNFLVIGGAMDNGVAPGYSNVDIYNPTTNTFTATGSMNTPRCSLGAAQLSNGKVLVASAWYNSTGASTAELFDPATGTFTNTGSLNQDRSNAILLPTDDGGAVVVCGYPTFGGPGLTSVEYYNSSTGTFSILGADMIATDPGWTINIDAHRMPYQNYQRLNGKYVLLAYKTTPSLDYALIEFDPSSKTFSKINTDFPLVDATTDGGFFGFGFNKNADIIYLIGINAGSDPQELSLVGVNLATGTTYHSGTSYTLPQGEYLSPTMIFIPSNGKILLEGVASYPDNYSATNKTYLITPSAATGVYQFNNQNMTLNCYPNPASTSLNMNIHITTQGNYTVRFYDIAGRMVYSEIRTGTPGENIWTFNQLQLHEGMYNVEVSGNNMVSHQTISIIK